MRVDLVSSYFEWLYSKIGDNTNPRPDQSYRILAQRLFDTPFYWFVKNDENRELDGLRLRDEFCDEVGSWGDSRFPFTACSTLEVLISLAGRAAFEGEGLGIAEGQYDWFWLFMRNIGLQHYDDDKFLHGGVAVTLHVDDIIRDLLDRKYGRGERGSLFPQKKKPGEPHLAQIEMWYQLQGYLLENNKLAF